MEQLNLGNKKGGQPMSHSKIRKIACFLFVFLTASLFAEEPVEVTSELKKRTRKELVFDVFLINNTEETLYFYPKGLFGYSHIEDDTFKMIFNYDGESPVMSAHDPYWQEQEYIELPPGKKIKYRYKKSIKNSYSKKTGYLYEKEIYDLQKIEFSLCVVDKSIKELNSFDEYIQCMKTNILAGKWFILYDSNTYGKK